MPLTNLPSHNGVKQGWEYHITLININGRPDAAAQLAAAVGLAPDRAVSDLGCVDPTPGMGDLPVLNLGRVNDRDGMFQNGKDKTSTFLLALTIAAALGLVSGERMVEFLREVEDQGRGAMGSLEAKRAFRARAFVGKLHVFGEFRLEVDSHVLLPGVPVGGGKGRQAVVAHGQW